MRAGDVCLLMLVILICKEVPMTLNQIHILNLNTLVQRAEIYQIRQHPYNAEFDEILLDQVVDVDLGKEIKLIVHGYLGNRHHSSVTPLKQGKYLEISYLAVGGVEVFVADWQDAANLDYTTSRGTVAKVSQFLGRIFEEFLDKNNIDKSRVHVIGHSLGAHIAGDIGRYLNGSLGRITGLDPALPLFTVNAVDAIQADCGVFVDIIHTDYPVFGDLTPRGTVDFYPNFGQAPQKGCDEFGLLSASRLLFEAYSCSHNRAVTLYAESIGMPWNFPAIPCTYNAIRNRNARLCQEKITQGNPNKSLSTGDTMNLQYMGEKVSRRAFGLFYLETYDTPPYGLGHHTQGYSLYYLKNSTL